LGINRLLRRSRWTPVIVVAGTHRMSNNIQHISSDVVIIIVIVIGQRTKFDAAAFCKPINGLWIHYIPCIV
jgi:hypothetical protein